MIIVRLDIDRDHNKPIIIPQYNGDLRIYKSKFDPNRLVAKYGRLSWDFNKFDILTGINLIARTVTIDELKKNHKTKSKSLVKKYIRRFIKKIIRGLKVLLTYFS